MRQPEGYLSTSDWGKRHGRDIFEVDRMCNIGILEYIRVGSKRFVHETTLPKQEDLSGWMTLMDFARFHRMSWSCARNLVLTKKVPTRKHRGKVMVWHSVQLRKVERLTQSGRKRIHWEVIEATEDVTCA